MRDKEITKSFGEFFVASLFLNMGYEVDLVDAEGIDLACYKKGEKKSGYGVSVKTRNIQKKGNSSINIKYNDIVYAYEQSKEIRGLEPAYALVVVDLKKIDILIVTQEYAFKKYFNIPNIEKYNEIYKNKKDSGATQSISICKTAKKSWKSLRDVDGVIFTASYTNE